MAKKIIELDDKLILKEVSISLNDLLNNFAEAEKINSYIQSYLNDQFSSNTIQDYSVEMVMSEIFQYANDFRVDIDNFIKKISSMSSSVETLVKSLGGTLKGKQVSKVPMVNISSIPVVIRPLDAPKEIYRVWKSSGFGWKTAIIDSCKKHTFLAALNIRPTSRYIMNVIDRTTQTIKVIEFPKTVYRTFMNYIVFSNGFQPYSVSDGADFEVSKTGIGLNTKYLCKFLLKTPLTQSEKEMVAKGLYDLDKCFPALDNETDIRNALGI